MKKTITILIVLILVSGNIFSDESQNKKGGYDSFFKENVGKEIIVNLNTIDISMSGTLLEVYDDGIILQTYFDKIFIAKASIAYAKVKIAIKKK
jgi:hypothetical protein